MKGEFDYGVRYRTGIRTFLITLLVVAFGVSVGFAAPTIGDGDESLCEPGDRSLTTIDYSGPTYSAVTLPGYNEYSPTGKGPIGNSLASTDPSLDPGTENPVPPEYEIEVYPNPNDGNFRLDVNGPFEDTVELNIINVTGKSVYKKELDRSGELFLSLQSMRKGIYFAQIRTENKVFSHPIIYSYDARQSQQP